MSPDVAFMCACLHVYMCMFICMSAYVFAFLFIYLFVYACTMHPVLIFVVYVFVYSFAKSITGICVQVCVYVCVNVCMYAFMFVYLHTYIHTYIHTYVHIHTCLCTQASIEHFIGTTPDRHGTTATISLPFGELWNSSLGLVSLESRDGGKLQWMLKVLHSSKQDLDETSNCAASMALGTPNGLKP